jgi:uncharacterized protein YndB with AHSA1/START domain
MEKKAPITVQAEINSPVEKAWTLWSEPEHIVKWAFASDDWEAPSAENDLRAGGTFNTRMSARDKSEGFDFTGVYTAVKEHELIEYDMDDGRHVKVEFEGRPAGVRVRQTFDPENELPLDVQREGWQAILDNFKRYAEAT